MTVFDNIWHLLEKWLKWLIAYQNSWQCFCFCVLGPGWGLLLGSPSSPWALQEGLSEPGSGWATHTNAPKRRHAHSDNPSWSIALLSPCSWEQACHPAVRGAGRELLGVCVRPQLGPLLPQPAPACPKTSGQPHRAAHFWQPSPRWPSFRAGCHNDHHASASAAGHFCLSDYRRRAGEGCECFEGTEPSGVSRKFCVFLYAAILWLPPSKESESQRIKPLVWLIPSWGCQRIWRWLMSVGLPGPSIRILKVCFASNATRHKRTMSNQESESPSELMCRIYAATSRAVWTRTHRKTARGWLF